MRRNRLLTLTAAAVVLVAGCTAGPATHVAPLFDELGVYHRPVSTASEVAQRYVDQGLTLYYGFNHEEAIASFRQAGEIDPSCAMAFWGMALAAGPNINNPAMDEPAVELAWEASRKAVALAGGATPVERDLIQALATRYAQTPPEDRRHLDEAYAAAMREVWRAHPDDADVGTLFAEALMDLRPWDLWSPEGEPRPETAEIMATLEAAMELDPLDPGPNHFYIHTMEASPTPERALAAADRLRTLVPGAGHLLHMPAHIDIRLGHYGEAIEANQRAIAADMAYVEKVGRHGFYTLYRAHNYHFLAFAAMFDGRRELAMEAARSMVAEVPPELVREEPDFLDAFLAVPTHVMVRFGLWEELLHEPQPPADLPATTAFWRYGRTVAFAALGRVEEGAAELAALKEAVAAVPESRLMGNNPASVVLAVGVPMAEGELEYRLGHYERAFELLRESVRRDDALHYDEPWGWMMPVRHSLGALLLEQGRLDEAEAVYRADLRLHPDNGWALKGLAECLHRSGRHEEAAATDARFRAAWARSDIEIEVSCYCRTGA